ncbi:hypothetical protein ACFL4N_02545 [Thermodesulfobacteriota bacterium]
MKGGIPIFIVSLFAFGGLVYLLWTSKSKIAKAMWGCFLASLIWGYSLVFIGDSFLRDPSRYACLGKCFFILLALLTGGLILALILVYRKDGG